MVVFNIMVAVVVEVVVKVAVQVMAMTVVMVVTLLSRVYGHSECGGGDYGDGHDGSSDGIDDNDSPGGDGDD